MCASMPGPVKPVSLQVIAGFDIGLYSADGLTGKFFPLLARKQPKVNVMGRIGLDFSTVRWEAFEMYFRLFR